MCGRYLLDDEAYSDILMILNELNAAKKIYSDDNFSHASTIKASNIVEFVEGNNFPVGEIFPTYNVPVIEKEGITSVKWGFPHWKNSGVIINARSETASEKSMFKKPLRQRRCIVPSGGFYEWSRTGGSGRGKKLKDKYLFTYPHTHMIYMGGIVNSFRDTNGEDYSAFVILTTAANDSVASIHDRMPVLLQKDEFHHWLTDEGFMYAAINRTAEALLPKIA